MEKLNAKVWIPAIILMTALITAIIITLLLQGRLHQLNDEVSELKSLIAAERETNDEALLDIAAAHSENKALRAEKASLAAENDALRLDNKSLSDDIETLRQYQLSFDLPYGFEIAIDQRLDPKLIDMLKKHFSAIAEGNLDAYRETLANTKSDYLLEIFENRKYTKTHITSIIANYGTEDSQLHTGFITVSYRLNGEIGFYDIGVTKKDGRWAVYDYD